MKQNLWIFQVSFVLIYFMYFTSAVLINKNNTSTTTGLAQNASSAKTFGSVNVNEKRNLFRNKALDLAVKIYKRGRDRINQEHRQKILNPSNRNNLVLVVPYLIKYGIALAIPISVAIGITFLSQFLSDQSNEAAADADDQATGIMTEMDSNGRIFSDGKFIDCNNNRFDDRKPTTTYFDPASNFITGKGKEVTKKKSYRKYGSVHKKNKMTNRDGLTDLLLNRKYREAFSTFGFWLGVISTTMDAIDYSLPEATDDSPPFSFKRG